MPWETVGASAGIFRIADQLTSNDGVVRFCTSTWRIARSLAVICSRDNPYPDIPATAPSRRGTGPPDPAVTLSRWFRPDEIVAGSAIVDDARRYLHDADPVAWAAALDAIAHYDRSQRTPGLTMPVTLVAAELDQVSTPKAMDAMASRLQYAEVHYLPGAAHMTPFTDPAALAAILRETARRGN